MALLSPKDREVLHKVFADMKEEVTVAVFTESEQAGREPGCLLCSETRALAEELAGLSDTIRAEFHDTDTAPEIAATFGIERVPALALLGAGRSDPGIRFFGIPAGYELATIVQALILVSQGETTLQEDTVRALRSLEEDVEIKVFVTPTCPYCPRAVLMANQMALAAERVRAVAIEATEFPELADRYRVMGVPKIVINDKVEVEGAMPEASFLAAVLHAAGARDVAEVGS